MNKKRKSEAKQAINNIIEGRYMYSLCVMRGVSVDRDEFKDIEIKSLSFALANVHARARELRRAIIENV